MSQLDYCEEKLDRHELPLLDDLSAFEVDDLCALDDCFQNIDELDLKGSDELTNIRISDFEPANFKNNNNQFNFPENNNQFQNFDLNSGDHVIQIRPSRGRSLVQGVKVYPKIEYEPSLNYANNAPNAQDAYNVQHLNNVHHANNVFDELNSNFDQINGFFQSSNLFPEKKNNIIDQKINGSQHMHALQFDDMMQRYDGGTGPRFSSHSAHLAHLNPAPMKRQTKYRSYRNDFLMNILGDKRNHALKPSLFSTADKKIIDKNNLNQGQKNTPNLRGYQIPPNDPQHLPLPLSPNDVYNMQTYPHDAEGQILFQGQGQHQGYPHPQQQGQGQGYPYLHPQHQGVPSDNSQSNEGRRNFLEYNQSELESILAKFEQTDPRRAFLKEIFSRKINRASDSDPCSPIPTQEVYYMQPDHVNNVNNYEFSEYNNSNNLNYNIAQENSGKSEDESLFVSRLVNQIQQQQASDSKNNSSVVKNNSSSVVTNPSVRRISSKKKKFRPNTKSIRQKIYQTVTSS